MIKEPEKRKNLAAHLRSVLKDVENMDKKEVHFNLGILEDVVTVKFDDEPERVMNAKDLLDTFCFQNYNLNEDELLELVEAGMEEAHKLYKPLVEKLEEVSTISC